MQQRITQRLVDRLAAPATGRLHVWDSEVPGFVVEVRATGTISFFFDYRAGYKRRRFVLGRHPAMTVEQARSAALDGRNSVKKGSDPQQEKQDNRKEVANRQKQEKLESTSIAQVVGYYLEEYASEKRSVYDDERRLHKHVLPRWGERAASEITANDVRALIKPLKKTKHEYNRVRALLHKMFEIALEQEWVLTNPVTKAVRKYHEDPREYWLQQAELTNLKRELDECPDQDQEQANALRLLILSGARTQEVLQARWGPKEGEREKTKEFDLERGWWTRPSHRNKGKRIEHVPLSNSALRLLRGMHAKANYPTTGPLFPGRDPSQPRTTLRDYWKQVRQRASLAATGCRIHDLRHTFASYLVNQGYSLEVIGKLLGHSTKHTPLATARYAHLGDEVMREASNAFGDMWDGLSDEKPQLVEKEA
jgi:integrase